MAPRLATLLAAAAVALLPGCGDDERDSVERYIERANAVQARYAPEFRDANEAYAQFAAGRLDAARADAELSAAERALREAHAELARLSPPPTARDLHERLLGLFENNAEFAAETTALARYLPAARKVLRRVSASGQQLSDRIRDAETPDGRGRRSPATRGRSIAATTPSPRCSRRRSSRARTATSCCAWRRRAGSRGACGARPRRATPAASRAWYCSSARCRGARARAAA